MGIGSNKTAFSVEPQEEGEIDEDVFPAIATLFGVLLYGLFFFLLHSLTLKYRLHK